MGRVIQTSTDTPRGPAPAISTKPAQTASTLISLDFVGTGQLRSDWRDLKSAISASNDDLLNNFRNLGYRKSIFDEQQSMLSELPLPARFDCSRLQTLDHAPQDMLASDIHRVVVARSECIDQKSFSR